MSLQNLVGISLEAIMPAREIVRRLLDGAARHIADAKVTLVSADTRFTSAYTAIRMLADVGLHAHGYRTLTSKPGHHQTPIQTLPSTLGVDSRTVIRLDGLHKQRNLTEYTGDLVPESAVAECLSQAQSLYAATVEWLRVDKKGIAVTDFGTGPQHRDSEPTAAPPTRGRHPIRRTPAAYGTRAAAVPTVAAEINEVLAEFIARVASCDVEVAHEQYCR